MEIELELINDDIRELLEIEALHTGETLEQVVNRILRAGLNMDSQT